MSPLGTLCLNKMLQIYLHECCLIYDGTINCSIFFNPISLLVDTSWHSNFLEGGCRHDVTQLLTLRMFLMMQQLRLNFVDTRITFAAFRHHYTPIIFGYRIHFVWCNHTPITFSIIIWECHRVIRQFERLDREYHREYHGEILVYFISPLRIFYVTFATNKFANNCFLIYILFFIHLPV